MSYTTTFKKFLKESREPEDNSRLIDDEDDDFPIELDDIEEMSTSAGAGGYETPNEISYNEYRKDPIASPKAKINNSINYINRGLKEIEKVVNHNVRLKQEMGVDNNVYWKSSRENLSKISERLLRVSKQLKELAS